MNSIARSSFLAVSVLAVSSVASAGIVVSTSEGVWKTRVNAAGKGIETETFDSLENGVYVSPFLGKTGSVNWMAAAVGGVSVADGVFSTKAAVPLTFTFDPTVVQGVAGNFFAANSSHSSVVTALVNIQLGDGTSYEGIISSREAFTGFWSTGAGIASITIDAMDLQGNAVYPSIDRMLFAVNGNPSPAPGAIALLGAVGLVGGRRRRD
jgi:MYXO-CTERM domain-containing protein